MYGKRPTGKFRQVARKRSEPYTLTRETETTGEMGETVSTEAQHTADLHLYKPSNRPVKRPTGETLEGGILGMCVPDEDVEIEDRLTHNGTRYEVAEKTDIPSSTEAVLTKLAFTRV